jgi:DNA-binding transcriptional LysR family regulator
MDLARRHLAAFVAVADAGGFSAAARATGIGQSALSRLVRDLEAALGASLLGRTTRQVVLTPAGRAALPRARAILAELETLSTEAREESVRRRARVVVAVPPLLAATLVAPVLAALRGRAEAGATLVEALPWQIPDLVRDGTADLGVGSFAAESLQGLVVTPLSGDELALFCPAGHPLAASGPTPIAWHELPAAGEVGISRASALRQLIEAARLTAGLLPSLPEQEASQVGTALALVLAGVGFAVLPRSAAMLAANAARGVVLRPLIAPAVERPVQAIRRRLVGHPGARLLLQELARQQGLSPTET